MAIPIRSRHHGHGHVHVHVQLLIIISLFIPGSLAFLIITTPWSAQPLSSSLSWSCVRHRSTLWSATTTTTITSGSTAIRMQRPTPINNITTHFQMISFYHFHNVTDPSKTRDCLFDSLKHIPGLRGTIYVATEGINAQMAIPLEMYMDVMTIIQKNVPFPLHQHVNLGDIVPISYPTFDKWFVRTRDAILRDGLPEPLDWNNAGQEISPLEWHTLLQQQVNTTTDSNTTPPPPPLLLFDCRNQYESTMGQFRNATCLDTTTFSETWSALEQLVSTTMDNNNIDTTTPLYIYCTGGIRCVKVGAYLTQTLGFQNVRRLQHGIIGYEAWVKEQNQDTLWEGDNFLFDKRRTRNDNP